MEGSGGLPEETVIRSVENITAGDEPLLTGEMTTDGPVDVVTTRVVPELIAYTPAHFRIGVLAIKCLLAILVFTLTLAIRRRDFLKTFVVMMLMPILLECGFDVYTEIRASLDFSGRVDQHWYYYIGATADWADPLHALQSQAVHIYGEVLTYYTTYRIFSTTWWLAVVEYSLASWLFWSSIFSSIGAFQYAHKAVARPDEISYTHFFRGFFSLQLLVVLPLAALDVLLAVFALPPLLLAIVSAIPRLAACIGALFLLVQALASLFVFCKRRDEYVKTSPYSQVRHSKSRLFWFILFQIVLQSLLVPYLVWAAISLEEDFSTLFHIPLSVMRPLALEFYSLHFSCLLLRPFIILIFSIILLSPYRKKFLRACCGCCSRD